MMSASSKSGRPKKTASISARTQIGMKGASSRGGRPKKPVPAGTRTQIGIRVGADVKRLLDAAITESGRTQSQEAELRIDLTFRAQELLDQALEMTFGRQLAGLLLTLGRTISVTGRRGAFEATRSFEEMDRWMANPYAFNQVVEAVNEILTAFRPTGSTEFPKFKHAIRTAISPDYWGRDVAAGALSAVKDPEGVNAGLPPEEQNLDRERWARRANALLGPAAANIKVPDLRNFRSSKDASNGGSK
jgi:hypothetical protein